MDRPIIACVAYFNLCCVFSVPFSYLFAFPAGKRLDGLWNALGMGIFLCIMFYFYVIYIDSDWDKIAVELNKRHLKH